MIIVADRSNAVLPSLSLNTFVMPCESSVLLYLFTSILFFMPCFVLFGRVSVVYVAFPILIYIFKLRTNEKYMYVTVHLFSCFVFPGLPYTTREGVVIY